MKQNKLLLFVSFLPDLLQHRELRVSLVVEVVWRYWQGGRLYEAQRAY